MIIKLSISVSEKSARFYTQPWYCIYFSWPRQSSECLLAAFISCLPSHLSFPTSWLPLLTPESLRASSLASGSGPFFFWTRKHHRIFDIINFSIWGHSWFSCNMSVLTINFELYPFSFLFAFSTKCSDKSFFFLPPSTWTISTFSATEDIFVNMCSLNDQMTG